jgi:hypothetical protein
VAALAVAPPARAARKVHVAKQERSAAGLLGEEWLRGGAGRGRGGHSVALGPPVRLAPHANSGGAEGFGGEDAGSR